VKLGCFPLSMVFGVTFVSKKRSQVHAKHVNIKLLLKETIIKSPNFTMPKNKAQCFSNKSFCANWHAFHIKPHQKTGFEMSRKDSDFFLKKNSASNFFLTLFSVTIW
jgi:hypothetical protein